MTWIQGLAIFVIASVIASPFLGEYLHNLRTHRDFKGWLADEEKLAADRKARIDSWCTPEELEYLDRIKRDYSIADAITRDDEAFHLDQDQPKRSA
jgi:hypothetical protein